MSPQTRYKESRDNWKRKAACRAEKNRYQNKELGRVKAERDGFKKELKEIRARVLQMERRPGAVVIQSKAGLVFLALQLFVVARIGFRAVSRVLGTVMGARGQKKVPCPQTIINWVTRLSLARIRSAPMLQGPPMAKAPFCNGLIWMIDMSIGLGTGKILTVLALNAHHHKLNPSAPCLHDVHCMAASVANFWTGESIAAFLVRLIASAGRSAAYLKDGGADLQKSSGYSMSGGWQARALTTSPISSPICSSGGTRISRSWRPSWLPVAVYPASSSRRSPASLLRRCGPNQGS